MDTATKSAIFTTYNKARKAAPHRQILHLPGLPENATTLQTHDPPLATDPGRAIERRAAGRLKGRIKR